MGKTLIFSFRWVQVSVVLFALALLGACGAKGKKSGTTDASRISEQTVTWNDMQVEAGLGAANRDPTVAYNVKYTGPRYAAQGQLFTNSLGFCFNNKFLVDIVGNSTYPYNCQSAASDVMDLAPNYSTPITAFDLSLWNGETDLSPNKYVPGSFVINSATVTTGEVRFDKSGRFVPVNVVIKDLLSGVVSSCSSGACIASQCDPRGAQSPASGVVFDSNDPRIVTGLYIMSEVTRDSGTRTLKWGNTNAARVYHRSLVQTLQDTVVGFDFFPSLTSSPAQIWFGAGSLAAVNSISQGTFTNGKRVLLHFGVTESEDFVAPANSGVNVPRPAENVVLGWCVNGSKKLAQDTIIPIPYIPMISKSITQVSKPSLPALALSKVK